MSLTSSRSLILSCLRPSPPYPFALIACIQLAPHEFPLAFLLLTYPVLAFEILLRWLFASPALSNGEDAFGENPTWCIAVLWKNWIFALKPFPVHLSARQGREQIYFDCKWSENYRATLERALGNTRPLWVWVKLFRSETYFYYFGIY